MVWNSTALMAAFDLLVIALAILTCATAVKHGKAAADSGDAQGPFFIAAAVILTALFCVADLATMLVLPFMVGGQKAYLIMEYLHLNVRFIVTVLTVALILVGLIRVLAHKKLAAVEIGSLTSQLVHCEEHERRRIANYLHDHISQSLAALRIKLDLAAQPRNEDGQSIDTRQFRELLDQAIQETEDLTYELHPPVLSEFGLPAAIEWLGNNFSSEHNVKFVCTVEGDPAKIDNDDDALLFRIARELMLNVVKHAQTDRARVTLRWQREAISIEIEDKGVGYDPDDPSSTKNGPRFGLTSVRERIAALGGKFVIDSQPGVGTRVALTVPLHNSVPQFVHAIG